MADPLAPGIAANLAAQKAVRARVVAFVSAAWFGLGSWRDSDIDRFVSLILPMVLAGQRTMAQLTDSYLAMLAAQEFGGRVESVGLPMEAVTGAAVRNGTPPTEVYQRAGVAVWTALAGGASLTQAVQRGGARAIQAAATDLQLAKTHASRQIVSQDPRVTGYARILEGAYSCGLCALASTQRYHKSDLLPIHPSCDCSVQPLYTDKGNVIDAARLEQVHALAADFFGTKATRAASAGSHTTRRRFDFRDFVVVHQHGELGPVLARKGQAFTGPDQIPA